VSCIQNVVLNLRIAGIESCIILRSMYMSF